MDGAAGKRRACNMFVIVLKSSGATIRGHSNNGGFYMRTQTYQMHAVAKGVLPFDEHCSELIRLLKLLDLSPLHTIASQTFIERFRRLVNAAEAFFLREEEVLGVCSIPGAVKRRLLASHRRIRDLLDRVHIDAIKGKNQTAIEVYERIGAEFERHLSEFSTDFRDYVGSVRH